MNFDLKTKKPSFRKRLTKELWIWLIALEIGIGLSGMSNAHAGSVKFLESVGTCLVIGTAIGASTLPFYEQPSQHKENILYGAAAGAALGLGIWVYGLFQDSEEEKLHFPNASSSDDIQKKALAGISSRTNLLNHQSLRSTRRARVSQPLPLSFATPSRQTPSQGVPWAVWFPIVSLNI